MSSIFGLAHLDGRPLQRKALDAMSKAMLRWGPDGVHTWHKGSVGLGFASLNITPESLFEEMPYYDLERCISLVAAARLDNRDELCDIFGISSTDRPKTPDNGLVMKAFQKWEKDCPKHLYGDWAFAVWDDRQQNLILARDQLGNTGLYYCHQPGFFAFASHPEALFAFGGIPRHLNESKLARHLTIIGQDDDFETIYKGVKCLIPAHSLSVTMKGIQYQRYWQIEDVPELHFKTDNAYLEEFLYRYRTAVRSRLRSTRPVGSMLSSGLDSGSVTALAAELLRQEGQKLAAFTSVPLHKVESHSTAARVDEWPLAKVIAEQYPNIEHISIPAENVTPIGGIKRALDIFHIPIHAAVNMFWIIALLNEAKSRGIGTLLTGQMGNGTISWNGGRDRIFFLLLRGEWDEGLKALALWKSFNGYSWFKTIKHHILRPLLKPLWSRRFQLLYPFEPPWKAYSPIHPEFAQRLGLLKAIRESGHDARFSKSIDPWKERKMTIIRNSNMAAPIWHAIGSAFGMEVRDPTSDVRLMEFCLGVPERQYVSNGGDRMLLRRAMKGRLPPEIQWNTQRGKQAADIAFRLIDHSDEMNTVLDHLDISPTAARYLNVDIVRQAWDSVRSHPAKIASNQAEALLLRGVMTGLFLVYLERGWP